MKQWMVALALVLVLGAATPSHAATQEVRVLAVGNDNSSLKADEKALEYARKRAVYLAARKLGVKDPSGTVAKFTDKQFADIIRGANVVKTRRDGTITYSEVNVTIVDGPLRRALKLPELPEDPADKLTMRAVLLLPLYVAPSRAYLWEKENLLREPLADEIRRQARGGILLPGGDLEDLRLIDYQNALTVKPEELKPMFDRYGAEEIIIAVLTPGASGTMDASSVLLRRLKIDGSRNEVIEIPPETAEEISSVRLAKSASAIANAITQIASSTAERDQLLRNKSPHAHALQPFGKWVHQIGDEHTQHKGQQNRLDRTQEQHHDRNDRQPHRKVKPACLPPIAHQLRFRHALLLPRPVAYLTESRQPLLITVTMTPCLMSASFNVASSPFR
jgi:hypothetical protein